MSGFIHGAHESAYSEDMMPMRSVGTCEECAFEAWERMTYGGVQLTLYSRSLLDWLVDVRFTPYGENRWTIDTH